MEEMWKTLKVNLYMISVLLIAELNTEKHNRGTKKGFDKSIDLSIIKIRAPLCSRIKSISNLSVALSSPLSLITISLSKWFLLIFYHLHNMLIYWQSLQNAGTHYY